MRVTIHTSDGGVVEVGEMDADSVLAFVEALEGGMQDFFHFDLELAWGKRGQSWIYREHIVRVDID